ncbi:hypothetical protein HK096_000727 [Nowakowskiella sp. JEL0078]|nr:hypothetical protein HK096_000727 [Nowakowskiella sp. JEL0078]
MYPSRNPSEITDVEANLQTKKTRQEITPNSTVEIVDIRKTQFSNTNDNLQKLIIDSISKKNVIFEHPDARISAGKGEFELIRSIPTLVLYDDRGLEIFDQITYIPEYYLTNAEINVFEEHANKMVRNYVANGSVLIELGVGSMRKTKYFLDAIVRQNKSVTYYALDLSERTLQECLNVMSAMYPPSTTSKIIFKGLLGTYEDSLEYVRDHVTSSVPKMFMWLGSSIGNLTRNDAASFLGDVTKTVMNVGDTFLCGIDRRNDPAIISLAYNDPHGLTREFTLNGLDHVNEIFGSQRVIERDNFEYVSIYNEVEGRHEAYYRSKQNQKLEFTRNGSIVKIEIIKDELINVEYSYKYSSDEVDDLVHDSKLYSVAKFTDSGHLYDLHLFQKPAFFFPKTANGSHTLVPEISEFQELWKAWDTISMTMIPTALDTPGCKGYLEKPITLRHPFIFYLGHLPSFMDILLSRCLKQKYTEPAYFPTIFERGIDPDVENPEKCHDHSEVPESWPSLEEVIAYRDRVRKRALKIFEMFSEDKSNPKLKRLARTIHMCFEHDAMHLETFLYMLVQFEHIKPPRGVLPPVFDTARPQEVPKSKLITVPSRTVTIGMNDPEKYDLMESKPHPATFGWDVEKPEKHLTVPSFQIQNRVVTVGEYVKFLDFQSWMDSLIPSSWGIDPNFESSATKHMQYGVKSVFGLVPLSAAWNWPVFVSNVQSSAYAAIHGMRLPTESELMSIRQDQRVQLTEKGRLCHANYGFSSWLPKDVKSDNESISSIVGDGWEWTSTILDGLDGFEASELYPGYSKDFFDTKHNVVVRGSWATLPRIAERQSFRNWYQRSYPFVFATFRCCL